MCGDGEAGRWSDPATVHLDNITNLRYVNELVHQSLSINLGQYSSLVVISEQCQDRNLDLNLSLSISPESSAHGLVVHVRLVLVETPQSGDRLAVHQLEDSLLSVCPFDVLWTTFFVLKIKHYYFQIVQNDWPDILRDKK